MLQTDNKLVGASFKVKGSLIRNCNLQFVSESVWSFLSLLVQSFLLNSAFGTWLECQCWCYLYILWNVVLLEDCWHFCLKSEFSQICLEKLASMFAAHRSIPGLINILCGERGRSYSSGKSFDKSGKLLLVATAWMLKWLQSNRNDKASTSKVSSLSPTPCYVTNLVNWQWRNLTGPTLNLPRAFSGQEVPPKCLLWALPQMDIWSKSTRFGKHCISQIISQQML